MLKIIFIGSPQSWHAEDQFNLNNYTTKFKYIWIEDSMPFINRRIFSNIECYMPFSYELIQRIWKIISLIPWSIYLRFRLSNNYPIHCFGLYAFLVARFCFIKPSRIIFSPQGSDILIMPKKYNIFRTIISNCLKSISYIIADSENLINETLLLASKKATRPKTSIIQNGVDIELLNATTHYLKNNSELGLTNFCTDLIWIRGLSEVYRFEYFLEVLSMIDKIINKPIKVKIVSAFGTTSKTRQKNIFKNIDMNYTPRLSKKEFYKSIIESKLAISIPSSDSSPRSLYESIILRTHVFATRLKCLDWLNHLEKSLIYYSTNTPLADALIIVQYLNSFDNGYFNSFFYKNPPSQEFLEELDYRKIAERYYEIFRTFGINSF